MMKLNRSKNVNNQCTRKKPPPRPPPPDFRKIKHRYSWNLIDISPPNSPRISETFGGSISSSFSSSSSSIASSKKSYESDVPKFNSNLWTNVQVSSTCIDDVNKFPCTQNAPFVTTPIQKSNPTIIRAQSPKVTDRITTYVSSENLLSLSNDISSCSLPMPSVPPPSPPKSVEDIKLSYGIALYNFSGTHPGDLTIQV